MTWWQSILLGVVQGLGEFLPISSSGHLVLLQNVFGIQGDVLLLDTMLHLATLVAVFVALWQDILSILKKPFQPITLYLVIATIPAVVAALLLGDFFEVAFSGAYLGWGFLISAVLLFLSGRLTGLYQIVDMEKVGPVKSLIIGVAQAIAIMPGVSRSGSTIVTGQLCGLEREDSARFAFLMSIPAILGSLVYQAKDILELGVNVSAGGVGLGTMLLGMLFAGITGFLALKWMLKIVKNGKLWRFGIYVGVLGILVLMDGFWWHLVF